MASTQRSSIVTAKSLLPPTFSWDIPGALKIYAWYKQNEWQHLGFPNPEASKIVMQAAAYEKRIADYLAPDRDKVSGGLIVQIATKLGYFAGPILISFALHGSLPSVILSKLQQVVP